MKMHRLLHTLLALILLVCLSGVQGQYSTPTSSYTAIAPVSGAAQSSASQYSQFYQMLNGPVPSNHISAPQQFDITGNMPSTVLFSNQEQSVNYAQYASSPSYTGGSSLWIQGLTSWTQYAVVPQGATLNLLAVTPTGGSGYLYFTDSDGQSYTYNYYFSPYSRLSFYADNPGRHVFSFVVNGIVSNQVIIDVTGVYTPPTNYLPPAYYPDYYYGYYPGFFGFNNFGEGSFVSSGSRTNGEIGGHTTGGEIGGHTTGGEIGGHTTGGETGDHTTGGETGDHTTGGENGGKK